MADHIFSSCCCFAMASLMRCYIHIACHDGESVSESLTPSSFFFSLAIETPSRRREKASVSEGTINIKKRGTFFAATDSPRSSVLCTCIGSASVSIASSSRDRFALAAAIGVDACCAKSLSSCLPALLFAKLFAAFLSYPAREGCPEGPHVISKRYALIPRREKARCGLNSANRMKREEEGATLEPMRSKSSMVKLGRRWTRTSL